MAVVSDMSHPLHTVISVEETRYVGRFKNDGQPYALYRAVGWNAAALVDGKWRPSPIACDYIFGDEIGINLTEAEARHAANWLGWPNAVPRDSSKPAVPVVRTLASDLDGVRHVVIQSAGNFAGYSIEVQCSDRTTRVEEFYETTVWGSARGANFLGNGQTRLAWVAICDHSDTYVRIVPPSL